MKLIRILVLIFPNCVLLVTCFRICHGLRFFPLPGVSTIAFGLK